MGMLLFKLEKYITVAMVLAVAVILLGGLPVFAQGPAGTILGVVKDASGEAVPGADITVQNAGTNETRTASSGDDGAYRVLALAVRRFNVRVEQSGFKTETQQGLNLDIAQE